MKTIKPRKVIQKSNGTWLWDIRNFIGSVPGAYGVAETEAQAVAERDRLIANLDLVGEKTSDPLFSKLIAEFCDECDGEKISFKQRETKKIRALEFCGYQTNIKGDNKFKLLGECRVSEVTAKLIHEKVRHEIFKSGRSHNTNRKRWTIFRSVCNLAKAKGYTNTLAYEGVKAPANPKAEGFTPLEVPADTDVRAMIQAARDLDMQRDLALIITAASTGLRVGELFGLRWADVDFSDRKINVRQALTVDNTLAAPKTKAAVRSVPMSDQLMDTLKEWKRVYKMILRVKSHHDLVFCNRDGDALDKSNYCKRNWNLLQKAAGVKFQLRLLRHYYASKIFYGGQHSIEEITYVMGHTSVAVTQKHYAHWIHDPSRDQSSVNKMNAVMGVL